MPKERLPFRKTIRNSLLSIAALYAGITPIVRHDITNLVITGLSGGPVDCAQLGQPETNGYEYSAIAVFGAGLYYNDHSDTFELTSHEKHRLTAAALLYIAGYAPTVIILDGRLPDTAHPDLSSSFLMSQVSELSQGFITIQTDQIIIDDTSINTATNIRELDTFRQGMNLQSFALVTEDFHGTRSVVSACANAIPSSMFTVSEVFGMFRPSLLSTLTENAPDWFVSVRTAKETIETVLTIYDPNGNIPTLAKKLKNANTSK